MVCCVCNGCPSQPSFETQLVGVQIGEHGEEFCVLVCEGCRQERRNRAQRSLGGDDWANITVEMWENHVNEEFWGNLKQVVLDKIYTVALSTPWSWATFPFYKFSWQE